MVRLPGGIEHPAPEDRMAQAPMPARMGVVPQEYPGRDCGLHNLQAYLYARYVTRDGVTYLARADTFQNIALKQCEPRNTINKRTLGCADRVARTVPSPTLAMPERRQSWSIVYSSQEFPLSRTIQCTCDSQPLRYLITRWEQSKISHSLQRSQ